MLCNGFSHHFHSLVYCLLFLSQRIAQRNRKKYSAPKRFTIDENENMGNGCSKNIRRLNKSTVVPEQIAHSSKTIPVIPSTSSKSHFNKTSYEENLPSTSIIEPQPVQNPSKSNTIAVSSKSPEKLKYFANSSKASFLVATIDTNSIIFDKSESKTDLRESKPPISRSISIDSSSDKSTQSESKKFSTNIHRLFKSNQNLTQTNGKSDSNRNLSKLYHRLSGSVQTLFKGNLNNMRKRNFSASDTNLSVNKINDRCALSQQQLIDNDYCPSVFYNRKARKSCSERNIDKNQFMRWKNQLWMKFSRRKSQPSVRKS